MWQLHVEVFDLAIHIAIQIFPLNVTQNYILTSSQFLNYMHLLFISGENLFIASKAEMQLSKRSNLATERSS